MPLYVANCTPQPHDFIYRLPEAKGTQRIAIPAGGQMMVLNNDATPAAIRSVIEHHKIFGMVDAADIDLSKKFVGLCYSTTVPVKMPKIQAAFERNETALTALGTQQRETATAGISNLMKESGPLSGLEIEVEEVVPRGEKGFKQTLEVSRDGKPLKGGKGRKQLRG